MRKQVLSAVGLALATLVAGCSPQVVKPLTPPLTDELVTDQIGEALIMRKYSAMGPIYDCSNHYWIKNVTIKDKMMGDRTAQVDAEAIVVSNNGVRAGSFAERCYGQIRGGWQHGEEYRYRHTYKFQLWDSGWRVVDDH